MGRRIRRGIEASNAAALALARRPATSSVLTAPTVIDDATAISPSISDNPTAKRDGSPAIVFNVTSSSSGDIYRLEAMQSATGLRFTCTCRAGLSGQACKHRIALLIGDDRACVDLNANDYAVFRQTANAFRIPEAVEAVAQAEAAVERAQKDLKIARKSLAEILDGRGSWKIRV